MAYNDPRNTPVEQTDQTSICLHDAASIADFIERFNPDQEMIEWAKARIKQGPVKVVFND